MKRRVADQLDGVGVHADAIQFFEAATDRVQGCTAISGLTFVVNGQGGSATGEPVGLIDWKFNGWAKYDNHRRDNRLPRKFAPLAGSTALGSAGRAGGRATSSRHGRGRD